MKQLVLLIVFSITGGFGLAQTEFIAYPATGKGVASTFVTDYHALGINPANLGWRSYEDKKFTMGSMETGFSLYSDALTKQTLRTSIRNAVINRNVDHISRDEAIGYAEGLRKF